MWKWIAVLLAALTGCAETNDDQELSVETRPRVSPNKIRVTNLKYTSARLDEMVRWLSWEGWNFWGYELETRDKTDVRFTWREARTQQPIAQASVVLWADDPVRIYVGSRVRIKSTISHVRVHCKQCDTHYAIIGWPQDVYKCDDCDRAIPVRRKSTDVHEREYRILVFGANELTEFEGLKGESHSAMLFEVFSGAIPLEHVIKRATTVDVVDLMRARRAEFELDRGQHVLAQLFPIGQGGRLGSFGQNGDVTFDYQGPGGRVIGTHEGYAVFVDGEQTSLKDYPHPVWEFELDCR